MKIAILSDIHGNKYALKEALRVCQKEEVDKYIFLGDYVGYYPFENEVIALIKDLEGFFIKGNHEDFLQQRKSDSTLDSHHKKWLINLPTEQQVHLAEKNIKILHATELEGFQYVYPDATEQLYMEQFPSLRTNKYDFIFTGHTHYPYIKNVKGTCLINPGSVGQSRDVGGLVSFGLLDLKSNVYRNIRLKYDIDQLIKELLKLNISEEDYRIQSLYRK